MATKKKTTKKTKTTSEPMIVRSNSFGAGITYQLRMVRCGSAACKKGCAEGERPHGPYWYRVERDLTTGKTTVKYHGKNEPTLEEIARHMNERAS